MKILGIDVGGTNIDIVLFKDKSFQKISTYSTRDHFSKLNELIKNLILNYNADAVGLSIAVWIKDGKFIHAPNLPEIPAIPNKICGKPVIPENDANCFALYASFIFGFRNIIGITVGTGIGSGIIIDGKIYRGSGIAGEIGHWTIKINNTENKCVCGGINHLECYFGGWSLSKLGNVKDLVKTGKIYELGEFYIFCMAVANAIMLLDPEAVIFGGRIGANLKKEKLEAGIKKYLMKGFNPRIEILKDELASAKGACLMALNKLEKS